MHPQAQAPGAPTPPPLHPLIHPRDRGLLWDWGGVRWGRTETRWDPLKETYPLLQH